MGLNVGSLVGAYITVGSTLNNHISMKSIKRGIQRKIGEGLHQLEEVLVALLLVQMLVHVFSARTDCSQA